MMGGSSVAEVHECGPTAHPLHPGILETWDIRGDVVGRDDHVGGERHVVPVTGSEKSARSTAVSGGGRRLDASGIGAVHLNACFEA